MFLTLTLQLDEFCLDYEGLSHNCDLGWGGYAAIAAGALYFLGETSVLNGMILLVSARLFNMLCFSSRWRRRKHEATSNVSFIDALSGFGNPRTSFWALLSKSGGDQHSSSNNRYSLFLIWRSTSCTNNRYSLSLFLSLAGIALCKMPMYKETPVKSDEPDEVVTKEEGVEADTEGVKEEKIADEEAPEEAPAQ